MIGLDWRPQLDVLSYSNVRSILLWRSYLSHAHNMQAERNYSTARRGEACAWEGNRSRVIWVVAAIEENSCPESSVSSYLGVEALLNEDCGVAQDNRANHRSRSRSKRITCHSTGKHEHDRLHFLSGKRQREKRAQKYSIRCLSWVESVRLILVGNLWEMCMLHVGWLESSAWPWAWDTGTHNTVNHQIPALRINGHNVRKMSRFFR